MRTDKATIYLETEFKSAATKGDLVNLSEDNITVTEVTIEQQELPIIKDAYKNYFSVGATLNAYLLEHPDKVTLVKNQFNSMTMENEMKPEKILDFDACIANLEKTNEKPALHFDVMEIGLKFAKENHILYVGMYWYGIVRLLAGFSKRIIPKLRMHLWFQRKLC